MVVEDAAPISSTLFILCCICGIEIHQNPANMCVSCLRDRIDITEGINKQVSLHSCRSCGRFLCPPWQHMTLESKELMAVCLRKISGLSKVKLIDAVWIWTEPHSMRLKIKITIQKEVMNGAILQQAAVIDFTIRNQQCKNCEASYAQGAWHAVVQVRQRVSHKRTFYFLEQVILKHDAHSDCIRIVTFRDGMDFYFKDKNQALRFNEFLTCHVPAKVKYSRKLVSADHCSNVGDFKHNFLVDIAPICKDDLVMLPKNLAQNLSNISRLVVIKRIGAGLHVVDPFTAERNEVNVEKYFRYNFLSIMNSRQLIRYVVLSVEPVLKGNRPSAKVRGGMGNKVRLAECIVAKEDDLGVNDTQFSCVSHLGNILNEGDVVLGYDLTNTNWNIDEDISDLKNFHGNVPDIILVRKYYGNKGERFWDLKKLHVEEEGEADEDGKGQGQQRSRKGGVKGGAAAEDDEADLEQFMQEIDADKEMRRNINIYKKRGAAVAAPESSTGDNKADSKEQWDEEEVRLDELLDDLTLAAVDGGIEEEDEDGSASGMVILSAEAADSVPAMQINDVLPAEKPFDASAFDVKTFKFT